MSGFPEDFQDFIDGGSFGGGNAVDPPTADDPGLGGGSGGGNSDAPGGSGSGSGDAPPPETQPPAPEPAPETPATNPPSSEEPPYEGDTGASGDSGDSGGDQGGSAPQPEDSKQGGYFIGELTDDPDPEETDIMDVLETGAPGEGTMVLTGRKKVEQEPVTEQPEPPPSPELVENYWLKGGLLVAIAIIVCLLFQNPRRKKS